MSEHRVEGSCLCGAVTLSASVAPHVGACHCDLCRRWGGGPMFALDGGTDVQVRGEVTVYRTTDWAQRGFCPACGTHLFIRVDASGRYILPPGPFELDDTLEFDHQIFVDKRPAWYAFANETREQTGEELFAEFAASRNNTDD